MDTVFYKHPSSFCIVISGPDAPDFLNRLSTINFKNFNEPKCGAFLTGKATILGLFVAWKDQNTFRLFCESTCLQKVYDYLNQMHFSEDLKIEKQHMEFYEVRGANVSEGIALFNWGIPGVLTFQKPVHARELKDKEWHMLRASHGYPQYLVDIGDESILIEGPFESWIDRNKGCYPGQEVIEKIYTYGRLPKKIFKVRASQTCHVVSPISVIHADENVGLLTSIYESSEGCFGLATLKRHFSDKNNKFQAGGVEWTVENI
jgi:folate-binding protein YgfZ